MSGASRMESSTDGSNFFAPACASALSRTAESAWRMVSNTGIEAFDIVCGTDISPWLQLKDKAREVGVLGEIADVLLDVGGIDLDRLAGAVGGGEGNLVEHAFH